MAVWNLPRDLVLFAESFVSLPIDYCVILAPSFIELIGVACKLAALIVLYCFCAIYSEPVWKLLRAPLIEKFDGYATIGRPYFFFIITCLDGLLTNWRPLPLFCVNPYEAAADPDAFIDLIKSIWAGLAADD